jgi:hypothetical protein
LFLKIICPVFNVCYINFHFDLIVKYFQPSGDEASSQMLSSSPAAALDFLNVQDFSQTDDGRQVMAKAHLQGELTKGMKYSQV